MSEPKRVSTWVHVQEHLAGVYNDVEPHGEHGVRIIVPVGDDTRRVTVRQVDALDAQWVEVMSTLGPARYVPPLSALARNFNFKIGKLCITEGSLAFRHLVPLVGLRVAELDTIVAEVAKQAAHVVIKV